MTAIDLPQGSAHNTISLTLGHPDPATLLTPELLSAMQQVVSSPQAYATLQYGPEQGTRSLINFLVDKIKREQGLSVQEENLMLVAGSTHAVDMLARLFARPGGVVLIEAPTYADSISILHDQQLELCSVAMDEDGLIPGELDKQIAQLHASGKSPSILYSVPNFHNPTGRTLPTQRRVEIVDLARRHGFLIVEDDVYRDLAFEGEVPPSFYALTNGEQAMSIGSFSKTLAPGLRLGWLLAPAEAIQRCVDCGTTQMGGGANPFVANIVAAYCRSGSWEKHIQHLRSLYKMRRDVALAALARYMPSGVQWTQPAGGFFIWLSLPAHVFAPDIKRLALQEGVALASGTGFFVNPAAGAHNLRLAFSCASPADIETGIRILAQVISGSMALER
jgi:2-aminoadipate transaminase